MIGISRRPPRPTTGVTHIALDLRDRKRSAEVLSELRAVTHVAAAVHEEPGLVAGWGSTANGDVFSPDQLWPAIAAVLGMEPGRHMPMSLARTIPPRQAEWSALVRRHRLRSPESLDDFVGQGFTYVDRILGHDRPGARPTLVSTIKARQAGFADCIDSEDMIAKWFARFQRERLLPPPVAA